MGTISSSVGLISGLDIENLVSQLVQLEAQPLRLLENRIVEAQARQTAFEALRVSFQASQGAINRLAQASSFRVKSANSSNEDVLTATATTQAAINNYTFRVKQLVSSQQLISRAGFATADSTSVGAGELIFRSADAGVKPETLLSELNNGNGVSRGRIRVVDSSGNAAEVDLRFALNVSDVIDAINDASGIDVRARVSGDRVVIEDRAGGTSDLRVEDVGGGTTALELGIRASSANGLITGNDVFSLHNATRLDKLNDGRGIRVNAELENDLRVTLSNGRVFELDLSSNANLDTSLAELNDGEGVGEGTIRITNRSGDAIELTLTGEETFAEVNALIDQVQPGFGVQISSVSGSGAITVSDSTTGTGTLKIEDISGAVAENLDLVGESEEGESTLAGQAAFNFDTIGALISRFANARDTSGVANGGDLTLELVDNGLRLTDNTGSSATIEALGTSQALVDLGLEGGFNGGTIDTRDLIAGLNTVLLDSLNGGRGFALGSATFTLKDGTSSGPIDFSAANTLEDVLDRIENIDGLEAEVGEGGVGIVITDTTGGAGTLSISGTGLDEFDLSTNSVGQIVSGDLHRQHIYENTELETLRGGQGIETGAFQITDRAGGVATVVIDQNDQTVGDIIDAINSAGIGIVARLSDHGDGITVEDTSGGSGSLSISEQGSTTTAADLGLVGESDQGVIAGSFSGVIDIDAGDTLNDVVSKINDSNVGLRASVINDGSPNNPYKLIVTSQTPGSAGEFVFTGSGTKIDLNVMSEAQDALLVVGDPDSPNSVLISSSSNTIEDAIDGVTLDLHNTSDAPVNVTIDQDIDSIVEDVKTFVETFNATLTRIDELTGFDPETEQRGALFSESSIRSLTARVFRVLGSAVNDPELDIRTLGQIGIFIDSSGGQGARLTMNRTFENGLTIDGEARLRELLEEDITAVSDFFTRFEIEEVDGEEQINNIGFAARFKQELDNIANGFDGVLITESQRIQDRIDLFQERAERLQELLDRKEDRLFAQFQSMETALANLQGQQSSLAALSNLAGSLASSGGGGGIPLG